MSILKIDPKSGAPAFSTGWEDFFNKDRMDRPYWERSVNLPATNIEEREGEYVIAVAAPGVQKEDFTIKVENDILSIGLEKQDKKEESNKKFARREFYYQSFKRSFSLPEVVDSRAIKATYENGILTLQLPKKREANLKPAHEIKVT